MSDQRYENFFRHKTKLQALRTGIDSEIAPCVNFIKTYTGITTNHYSFMDFPDTSKIYCFNDPRINVAQSKGDLKMDEVH